MKEWMQTTIKVLALITVIAAFVFLIVSCCNEIGSDLAELNAIANQTVTEKVYLQSASLDNEVKGRFVLGCGYVHEREYFVCYAELEDGGLKLVKFDAYATTIYQTLDKDEQAYAIIETNIANRPVSIKLYVPEDTVQMAYDLSLTE